MEWTRLPKAEKDRVLADVRQAHKAKIVQQEERLADKQAETEAAAEIARARLPTTRTVLDRISDRRSPCTESAFEEAVVKAVGKTW